MSENRERTKSDLSTTAVVTADSRLPETYLSVSGGRYDGRRYRLHKTRLLIGAAGRGAENDISFDLQTLSARHAAVELQKDGGVQLWDLKSSNGTFINGKPVQPGQPYTVELGDQIGLGPDLVVTIERPGHRTLLRAPTHRDGTASQERPRGGPAGGTTHHDPPGIRSDVPLGKILGYLISSAIIGCTLFGILNDAFDFVGLVQGWISGGSSPG